MTLRWWLVPVLAITGCVRASAVSCGEEAFCPAGTECVRIVGVTAIQCVGPDQRTACAGVDEGAPCSYGMPATQGLCREGGCIPSDGTCRNGLVDATGGEQCDDGNVFSHDGCSYDCRVERPVWTRIPPGPPPARTSPALAWDGVNGQVMAFGGADVGGAPLSDTWAWNGVTWRGIATSGPSARAASAMAFDAKRRQVVLFGGSAGGGASDDTWLWDGARWRLALPAQSPPGRSRHTLAYDPRRDRIVMFGGLGRMGNVLPDQWEWDGTTWSPIVLPSAPPRRFGHAMAYDARRGNLVLFGGVDKVGLGQVYLRDTWTLDASGWQLSSAASPAARADAAMAFTSEHIALFGGHDAATVLDDLWIWNGATWSLQAGATSIVDKATDAPGAAHDPVRGEAVVFGGTNGVTLSSNTWTIAPTGPTTASLQFSGGKRIPLSEASTASDPTLGRSWMFGGLPMTTAMFALDGDVWHEVIAQGPPPVGRRGTAMAFHAARGISVLFGGIDEVSAYRDDTWLLDDSTVPSSPTWSQVPASTPRPAARSAHAMTYDAAHHRIVLFGGAPPTNNETWAWDGAWAPVTTTSPPPPRYSHALAYDARRGQVVLFGGQGQALLGDTWVLDDAAWTKLEPLHLPLPRAGASLTWNPARQRLVLSSGVGPHGIPLSDAWEWTGDDWEEIVAPSAPPPRGSATLVRTSRGDGVILSGGALPENTNTPIDDAWLLRWESTLPADACRDQFDSDQDLLVGCADPDCWALCAPACPPGSTDCTAGPRCGDQMATPLETCGLCPDDIGACQVCGNFTCDANETGASCPGDCP